ncbi:hypothetical protein LP415_08300 [Polaromonas sp. P1(28)-8]|nr:hypothetical protein LP415_08300 [Polaromonas sp. P1(28)-8]
MRQLLAGPGQKAFALRFKILFQRRGRELLGEWCFLQAGHVKVDQRQVDVWKVFFGAQQPAINLQLRPVQLPAVLGHGMQVAAKGLHFFELVERRVIAVSPAPHGQCLVVALQAHFRLVGLAAPRCHQRMAGHAFLRGGRWRKAQVEVAMLGGERAQGPDGYKVFQSGLALAGDASFQRGDSW